MIGKFSRSHELKNIQELRQKLSPMQVLRIKITQSPRLELEHLIYQELEANPMLEFVKDDELNEFPYEAEKEEKDQLKKALKEFFEDDFSTYFTPAELKEPPEKQIPYVSTLAEELKSELRMETSDDESIKIGEYIIDSLNDKWFLDTPPSSIAEYFGVEKDKIEELLKLIQRIGPPGIAAQDSRESKQLQMERNPEKWKLELKIVKNYWDFYKKKEIEKLSNSINIDREKIKKAFKNIEKLNPHPTSRNSGRVRYVIPTVVVKRKGEDFEIAINEPNLPFIRLNTKYLQILQSPRNYDKKTVGFVEKWLERAKFILQSLEMRKKNFRNVINYITQEQKDFFKRGVLFMKPLKLKVIAEATNLSESTISRYIKDTYIQTPRGVFHLKYLLSGGIKGGNGMVSTNAIKEKINRMIEIEGEEPLSDEEINKRLKMEGINISRRTVTKYRNQMEIPSRPERKKEKKLNE